MFSVWWYYRRAFAQGGRIISANACLILHIFQMCEAETRKEVAMDVMIHQQAEREAQRMHANHEELVEPQRKALVRVYVYPYGHARPLLRARNARRGHVALRLHLRRHRWHEQKPRRRHLPGCPPRDRSTVGMLRGGVGGTPPTGRCSVHPPAEADEWTPPCR